MNDSLMQMQKNFDIWLKGRRSHLYAAGFFVVFYTVGIIGLAIPSTFHLFVKLIPFALLLSFAALLYYHKNFKQAHAILFFIIYITSYLIEVAGVKTLNIFGDYHYGNGLGLKFFETPVIIGLNWVLLVYLTASVIDKYTAPVVLKIIAGAFLMLLYDVLIEQVAPELDMWHWHTENAPLQNYLVWFILALIFHTLLKAFRIRIKNILAPYMLGCQFLFFAALNIFSI